MLACLVGLALALWIWKRAPRAALCLSLGLVVLLVVNLFWAVVHPALLQRTIDEGWEDARRSTLFSVISIVSGVVSAVGLVLVVLAAVLDRPRTD